MKQDWIWMPHAGHLCIGTHCRFHLKTQVNGYIISTVGEWWPDQEVRRIFLKSRSTRPKLEIDKEGLLKEVRPMDSEDVENLLNLKGDSFDDAYLSIFGYEKLGLNRTYETMVFKAVPNRENLCCPWEPDFKEALDFQGYNDPADAYKGHLDLCEKWDKEVHSSQYKEKRE